MRVRYKLPKYGFTGARRTEHGLHIYILTSKLLLSVTDML